MTRNTNTSLALAPAGGTEPIIRELVGARERIEAAFLEVGARLFECADILGRISSSFEALPQDLESPDMVEAAERLEAVARTAERIAASFAAEKENIAQLVAVIEAAQRPVGELLRSVKMMSIVSINARVVAAGVVDQMDDFDVFTTDIATLSSTATTTIKQFFEVYRTLSQEVLRADDQRARFEASHKDTLATMADELRQSLVGVNAYRSRSAQGSAETGRLSRDIANQIANVVSALQIGDTTRQRVEHIEAGLAAIEDLAAGRRPQRLPDDVELGADPALIAAIHRLGAAQLSDTTESFNREMGEAVRALDQLAGNAAEAIARSRAIYGDADDGAGRSSLALLTGQLRTASEILRDCEAERAKLDRVANAVQHTVGILLDHVEKVQETEANMRLVSLNAAVKCAQLGPNGRALDVIATQLRQLTEDTVSSAGEAMDMLHEAASLARTFSAAAADDAAGQIGRLVGEANLSLDLLDTVMGRVGTALAALESDGPKAVRLLEQAAGGFTGHEEIAGALTSAGTQIAERGTGGTPDADHDLATREGLPGAMLALLRKTYTMESERRIHDRLVGKAPAPASPAGEDIEMFGDADLELFASDDDVTLFGDDAPAAKSSEGDEGGELDDIFF